MTEVANSPAKGEDSAPNTRLFPLSAFRHIPVTPARRFVIFAPRNLISVTAGEPWSAGSQGPGHIAVTSRVIVRRCGYPRQVAVSDAFESSVGAFAEDICRGNPTQASQLGLARWDEHSLDMSASAIATRHAQLSQWLKAFQEFDVHELGGNQRIDHALITSWLGATLECASFEAWRRNPDPYLDDGIFALFLSGTRSVEQTKPALCARLGHIPDRLHSGLLNLDPGLASPAILLQGVDKARGQATYLRRNFAETADIRPLAEQAAAAYDNFAAQLELLAGKATGTFCFGEARYNAVLKVQEQLSMTAAELQQAGRDHCSAIEFQMNEISIRNGYTDWRAFIDKLRDDRPSNFAEMLVRYKQATARARSIVSEKEIISFTEGEHCKVEIAPEFVSAVLAVPRYFEPAPHLNSPVGIFCIPVVPEEAGSAAITERLRDNASCVVATIVAHEAYPGHHMHYTRMLQAPLVRQLLMSMSLLEGWGLYAERVMAEYGFFENDAELLGHLWMRLLRAVRAVVDVDLHLGHSSLAEAETYLRGQAGISASMAKAEVLRYANEPTQASSYLAGDLAIQALRETWEGSGGSLREFHDAITSVGPLPPSLAKEAMALAKTPATADK